jgi:hypothetical protein
VEIAHDAKGFGTSGARNNGFDWLTRWIIDLCPRRLFPLFPRCVVAFVFGVRDRLALLPFGPAAIFGMPAYAALSAVASLYIVVLLHSAVMLVALGPYSLMILMSAVMALPFVIALAFAGASLGYLIQKRSRRSATGAMGLALKMPRYDRRPT